MKRKEEGERRKADGKTVHGKRLGCHFLLPASAFLLCCALGASAQGYPQRAVRLIVPFAAGGTTDGLGRILAAALSERLGHQVVVENRPGGGGIIGSEAGARARPDGYTLLLGSAETYGMTQGIAKRLAYNPETDLVPVVMLARAPNTFTVHPSVPARTLKQLIILARANPGKLHYGSPGVGSNPHLIGELFRHRYQLDLQHVPYKGGGASIIDVISGQIEMVITGIVTVATRTSSGQVRVLAVTGAKRTPLMPDVPTMAEAGVDDFVLGALFGLLVPSGTPAEATARLTREITALAGSPDFRKRLVDIGQEGTEPLAGEAFARVIRAEAQRWRELAAMAGVKDD
ncbi:MAG TPA: tripartite tricarboxylate transporter substrate binding protein [Burkholderiales bacterium]|nr:tripartite tricarboxylate transporter substrate binding protein [Burkholderiales bacterium]